ncbi:MAG TPA: hypothetical protein VF666_12345 [Pyrinomonadaceae bacterium]|jgi:response regulator RpfG family c-di-GMP phosphodiesterase
MRDELINLLWVDDDSYDSLDPLARRLRRANFHLERAVDYEEAIAKILAGDYHSILLDVIIPRAKGSAVLSYDLGMVLADQAAETKVKNIVFLTVVQQEEVFEKYNEIRDKYDGVLNFSYLDKTKLLEPNFIADMISRLKR